MNWLSICVGTKSEIQSALPVPPKCGDLLSSIHCDRIKPALDITLQGDKKQDGQCMHNVRLRSVYEITAALKMQ
jgi:hypothetical protein